MVSANLDITKCCQCVFAVPLLTGLLDNLSSVSYCLLPCLCSFGGVAKERLGTAIARFEMFSWVI